MPAGKKNCIAIITARGGSKRIPGKNIRNFLGKPIISYSIKAALESGLFSTVMVSTDDKEIADIASGYGASVPFLRSAVTSDDHATTADVILEVLKKYEEKREQFEYACCIYPTAPFVDGSKLKKAHQRLLETNADCVLPVTRYDFSIWRSFKIQDGYLAYNWPEYSLTRSQDLPETFHDCGQFYFFNVKAFLQSGSLVSPKSVGMEIHGMEMQDIDTEEDWKIAEFKYKVVNNIIPT